MLAERPIRHWHAVLKSAMDYSLGALATLALLPALGAIALAIRVDDPGPVLFKQRRHGYNNREFDIYKFRTMRLGANPSDQVLKQTVRGDPRITRVGAFLRKWSLDELPQLFNVLRGEMSLVGPRPHAVVMRTEERLGEQIVPSYPHRHRVKPGITGWAQVHGARGATDTAEQLRRRIELDLYYIEHCSPLLDLKVLLMTCREVLRATNAF
jgi:exopolysaccharide biosynthesis polyprenyl glycosylphosphotransferase